MRARQRHRRLTVRHTLTQTCGHRHEWDTIQESGKQLEEVHAPGHVGLRNVGNTCYMNSLLQVLFSLPEFQQRYAHRARCARRCKRLTECVRRYNQGAPAIFQRAPGNAGADLDVQLAKTAVALCTDKYSTCRCSGLPSARFLMRARCSLQEGRACGRSGHVRRLLRSTAHAEGVAARRWSSAVLI